MSHASFGALNGVKVIDLTQMLAGPYCTQMLADHGADVIKIEPIIGEESRKTGPFSSTDTLRAFGGYYASVNRNKRSLALDLKHPDAREVLMKLIDSADVVVENFRAGVMDRLGLSYELLQERNPKLVYAAIRGFGDPRTGQSPYVNWPAFDVVAQAMGGLMQINGPDPATPMKVGPGVGDLMPAAMCAFGIASALLHAHKTGKGQFVDVCMVDSVLSLCERIVHQHSFEGAVPHPEGNRHPLLAPFGLFRAADGYVTIAAHTDPLWAELCRLLGRDDLITDPRTATRDARVQHRDVVYNELEGVTAQKTKKELADILGGKIPFGPVQDITEIIADPHYAVRAMIESVPHPGMADPIQVAGIPVKMTGTPGRVVSRAPLLGEHTDEVLGEIGLSAQDIQTLRGQRAAA